LRENVSAFDFTLTADDMNDLARLDMGETAARDADAPENGH
jgi:2,5-diketo-D-gluconate reductase A